MLFSARTQASGPVPTAPFMAGGPRGWPPRVKAHLDEWSLLMVRATREPVEKSNRLKGSLRAGLWPFLAERRVSGSFTYKPHPRPGRWVKAMEAKGPLLGPAHLGLS